MSAKPDFPFEIDISSDHEGWTPGHEQLAMRVLSAAAMNLPEPLAGPAEVSVLLTGDEAQRALNARWRGKDKSTNVLSFPQLEPDEEPMGLLGDLSLAFETVAREAEEQDKGFEQHFAHLLVHGLLHLLGYDHETRKEALVMEALEIDILSALGYPDPYGGEEPED